LFSILQASLEAHQALQREPPTQYEDEGRNLPRRSKRKHSDLSDEEEEDGDDGEGGDGDGQSEHKKSKGGGKSEKRLSRYRSSPSKALLERMDQALEVPLSLLSFLIITYLHSLSSKGCILYQDPLVPTEKTSEES